MRTVKRLSGLAAITLVLCTAPVQAGPILTGLNWWLDASDSSTLTLSGSQVTQWNDKNPNVGPVDVSQSLPGSRPTLPPGALNGLPVVSFSAPSQQNLNDGVSGGSPISGAVQTMFVVSVATKPATGEHDAFDSYPNQTGGTPAFHAIYTDTSGIHIFRGGGGGDVANGNYTAGDYILMTSVWNGASSSVSVDDNGSMTTTTGTLSTSAASPNDMFLGGLSTGSFFNGGIAEILIYNSVLSSSDIQTNNDYLIAKWFTPVPEPASLALLAIGGVISLFRRQTGGR